MKKKDCLKVFALLLAASCGAGVAYGQSGFHGSGAMSQQSYTAPGGSYGFDSYGAVDGGVCDEGIVGVTPGFFGGAEWLSWQVSGGSGNSSSYATLVDAFNQTEHSKKNAKPDGNGVRGKIGYRTANMWDVAVGYTYFNAKDSGGTDSQAN